MRVAQLLVLGSILGSFVGCGKDFDFSKKEDPKPQLLKALFEEDFKVEVAPDPQPSNYWLRISWPKDSGQIVIQQDKKRIFRSNGKQRSFEKLYKSGEHFTLEVYQTEIEDPSLSQEISIPIDLEISNSMNLTKDFEFKGGRVFITGPIRILTSEFNFNIEAEELHSENALIETFSSQTAPVESNGRSAGNIAIKSKKAVGKLSINLRGENGGNGKPSVCIRSLTILCNASNAGNGGDFGIFKFESENSKGFILETNKYPGIGGRGGIACLYDASKSIDAIPRNSYIAPENNCEGHGRGTVNGSDGIPGTGELCVKLNKDDRNVCE